MNLALVDALDAFVEKYTHALEIEYDSAWPSDCVLGDATDGEVIQWRPLLRKDVVDFTGIEKALEFTLHSDIKDYYARYWSDNLNAKNAKGSVQLLQAWNADDFERLQQNLIGHILMKRRLGQPETLFFGLTDEDDFIVSVDNNSGQVMLEQVGVKPTQILAESLAEFIQTLEPDTF